MSCADRPRKELKSKKFKSPTLDRLVFDVPMTKRALEKAKTEAKIEVLEEVAKNSGPGDSRYGDFYYLIGEILETLSNLKKKKK